MSLFMLTYFLVLDISLSYVIPKNGLLIIPVHVSYYPVTYLHSWNALSVIHMFDD